MFAKGIKKYRIWIIVIALWILLSSIFLTALSKYAKNLLATDPNYTGYSKSLNALIDPENSKEEDEKKQKAILGLSSVMSDRKILSQEHENLKLNYYIYYFWTDKNGNIFRDGLVALLENHPCENSEKGFDQVMNCRQNYCAVLPFGQAFTQEQQEKLQNYFLQKGADAIRVDEYAIINSVCYTKEVTVLKDEKEMGKISCKEDYSAKMQSDHVMITTNPLWVHGCNNKENWFFSKEYFVNKKNAIEWMEKNISAKDIGNGMQYDNSDLLHSNLFTVVTNDDYNLVIYRYIDLSPLARKVMIPVVIFAAILSFGAGFLISIVKKKRKVS